MNDGQPADMPPISDDDASEHHVHHMKSGRDTDPDGQWMTYAALADARHISRASAHKLAKRHKWRRRTDNRGIVWVHVPHMQDEPAPHLAQGKSGQAADIPAFTRALDMLADQLARERDRADKAEDRANRADAACQEALDRAGQAEAALARVTAGGRLRRALRALLRA